MYYRSLRTCASLKLLKTPNQRKMKKPRFRYYRQNSRGTKPIASPGFGWNAAPCGNESFCTMNLLFCDFDVAEFSPIPEPSPANTAHAVPKPASHWKRATLAAVFSLLVSGTGQLYNRQPRKGLIFACVSWLIDFPFIGSEARFALLFDRRNSYGKLGS
jgi:hypothetical protein